MTSTFLQGFQIVGTPALVDDPVALSEAEGLSWLPAAVPGGVHEALLSAGVIGHPYFGGNDASVRWVEDVTWWYRTRFSATPADRGSRVSLVLHGVDAVASVWLNGRLLGRHESQFRPAAFDVTSVLAEDNELLVRFDPPLAGLDPPASVVHTAERMRAAMGSPTAAENQTAEVSAPGALGIDPAMTLRRKGSFSWGWDFVPRLPAIGLIGPVELRIETAVVATGHHLRVVSVDAAARTARVAVTVDLKTLVDVGPLTYRIAFSHPAAGSAAFAGDLADGGGDTRRSLSAVLDLTGVALWWTHDLGDSVLYDVVIEIVGSGHPVARIDERVGLRTITLDRSEDLVEGGRLFRFVLNGVPVFARGANWVPVDAMVGSVTSARCRVLVERARAANMTMLRVWGGGLYEQDAFYDACDELGILVWQDFMFACTDYPSDNARLRLEVHAEAAFQVRRLRNHPSVALWAGNNEVHAIHQAVWGNLDPGDWGYGFFHDVLPAAVEDNSPGTVYWPVSPWGDFEQPVNGVLDGDRHAWEVWHGLDAGAGGPADFPSRGAAVHFSRYQYDSGKFISEFGLQSSPALSTLTRWTAPGSLAVHSPALESRNKDVQKDTADAIMEMETGLPTSIGQFVENTMICQAEGLKFGIEHYRRRQPHCSGTLVWQLNDAWPGLSWSVIDYDLVAKAGYYYVQRAYRPVLASFEYVAGELQLWVTNSGRHPVTTHFDVEVSTFEGHAVIVDDVATVVDPGTSRAIWSRSVDGANDRFAWVSERSGTAENNRLFFGPIKDQLFGRRGLRHSFVTSADGTAEITVRSTGFNYLTRVETSEPGVSFDTNYLDLRNGDFAVIRARGVSDTVDVARLRVLSRGAVSALTRDVS